MSKKTDLNDFFTNQKKSKPTAKKQSEAASNNDASADQVSQEQKPLKDTKKKLDYESSEEEKTELELDTQAIIKNKADIDAANRKRQQEEQDNGASGWRALENQR